MIATNVTATPLPAPSKAHATCSWCRTDFGTIVELLDHVDNGHLDGPPTAHRRQASVDLKNSSVLVHA